MSLDNSEKIQLLQKAIWNYKDIMSYFGFKKNKAIDIKKQAAKEGGFIKVNPSSVTTESVLKLFSTTRTNEMNLIIPGTFQQEVNNYDQTKN